MNLHNDDGTLNEAGQKIVDILDSKEFMSDLYEGLDDKTREELGQFYTPAKICIQMIEMFNATDFSGKNVLDPCCGSGNLLIAMLAAGADSDKLYGNDYDERAVKLCRKRINRVCDILGKPHIQDWQIHQGNALQARCLIEFGEEYDTNYDSKYIDDLEYAQSYEHDEEQTFLGETIVYHIDKLSWAAENKKARERLKKRQQLEKINAQKMTEKTENKEQPGLFGDFFGGN